MFRWNSKLKILRKALKEWSRKEFGNNKICLGQLRNQLNSVQQLAPFEDNLVVQAGIQEAIEVVLAREEMYLHQRSRVNWFNHGDRNSSFFHASMIQRRQRNQILRLKTANGNWKDTDDGIDQEIASYFSSIFHDDGPRDMASVLAHVPLSITEEMNTLLLRSVEDHEIKAATFQMGALKAPGSDGFPGLFFQQFWEVIKGDTCAAIKSFFSGNYLLKKLNHTNIVLVPKIPHPEALPHFKPISLCNFSVKIISKVVDFINTTSGAWSIPKLKQVLSEEEALSISCIPISKTGTEDSMLWDFTTNGKYSVKSGYHKTWNDLILSKLEKPTSSINPPSAFWKFLWNLSIPPKLKHFWWKVCRNRLATKENLVRRNCANTPMCPRCGKHSESIEHLLCHCKWAKKVWFKSPISGGFFPNNINSALSWSIAAKEEMDKGARVCLHMERWLGLWVRGVNSRLPKKLSRFMLLPPTGHPKLPKFGQPPPPDMLKINYDASWIDSAQKSWGGIILRNSRGCLLDGRRFCISANSAFIAEAFIFREACLFAKALNLQNVSIESDCASLISLSVSELVPPWEVLALITDIRKIGAELELSFCWTPREGNEAAHWIASSRASTLGCNWVSFPPIPLLNILCKDASVYQ
ncbi:hypothetical protein RHSIM_Rhsim01G0167200 [Rhododendron simsii]|uniref:Reverse transcriptase n=1 Tax=Rhododendron simsii TaxID=118357 RepID=A0A834HLJ4_RHOSS|nr:hypothetical protein RHSIM_Rhsim01G0167200 [Rhododendron simsii]